LKYQIVITGFGGQGVVFLVKILSLCAGNRDLNFLGTENHGMSQRGGSVRCDIKIGDFYTPVIDNAQANLLIGLDQNETLQNLHLLKNNATIVANIQDRLPSLPFEIFFVDANQKAIKREFPIETLNIFMLGICLVNVRSFPFGADEVKTALTQINPKVAKKNIEVLELGMKSKVHKE
jgi:indolepyruvate ferredoxin oxidoreductase beta subunit